MKLKQQNLCLKLMLVAQFWTTPLFYQLVIHAKQMNKKLNYYLRDASQGLAEWAELAVHRGSHILVELAHTTPLLEIEENGRKLNWTH